jgi:hypothetical protein
MEKPAANSDRAEEQRLRQRLDELLDEALRESFPASDVPSVANPELDEIRHDDGGRASKPS